MMDLNKVADDFFYFYSDYYCKYVTDKCIYGCILYNQKISYKRELLINRKDREIDNMNIRELYKDIFLEYAQWKRKEADNAT
jgi:hypothetical protein